MYYNHYNYFDSNFLSWCFLEQALIHKYLIQHSPTYEIAVNTGDAFLFEDTINVKVNDKFNIDRYDAPHFSGTEKYKTETLEYIIKKLDYRLGEKQLNHILENF